MKKLLLSVAILSLVTTSNAASVSGNVQFSVDVPEIIVLYHWNTATLNLTANSGIHKPNGSGTGTGDITVGTYNVSGTLNTDDPLKKLGPGQDGKILVKLVESWGVRSIAKFNPQLTLGESTTGSYTLKNSNNKTLTISDAVLKCTTASTATGANCPGLTSPTGLDVVRLAPGWAPKTGNIEFTLDLSNLEEAGVYSSGGSNANTFNLKFDTKTSN